MKNNLFYFLILAGLAFSCSDHPIEGDPYQPNYLSPIECSNVTGSKQAHENVRR